MIGRDAQGCLFWLGLFVGVPVAAALLVATGLSKDVAFLLLFGAGFVIVFAVWAIRELPERRKTRAWRRQAEAVAKAEREAQEARRCRPCARMDRATLIAHVAEFATRFPDPRNDLASQSAARDRYRRRLATGLTTEHLRTLCAVRDRRRRLAVVGERLAPAGRE